MDGPIERPHMGLIDVMMCPVVGGVAGVSTTTDLGCSGDATMSPRGLPRPTPVVGLGMLYLIILLY